MVRIRSSAVAWSAVGDESVVLDLQTSTYLTLNGTATLLWGMAAEGTTEEQMAARLTDEYDVDAPTAASSAAAFVADLRARGYLGDEG